MARPSGTVTFLFTDVEGSTRLWAEHTSAMDQAVARHDGLVRDAIDAHGGYVFSTAGDSFAVAFASPAAGVRAAVDAQVALHAERWEGLPFPLRARMGLHTGTSAERGGDYFGPTVNLAARVMSAAWGGQILCTGAVAVGAASTTVWLGDHRLRDVPGTTQLHQVVGSTIPNDFPAPRTLDVAPSTLPAQVSTFVGRRSDIDAVRRLLFGSRLTTLTGPGGTGKTRLAVEVAGREAPRRPGGTYFADLSSLVRADDVAATVARACLAPPDPGRAPVDQLVEAVADRHALLVLDNCEHLLDVAAALADRLLVACPNLSVLATSREALDLPGEHVYRVQPLDRSGPDARALFIERAIAGGGTTVDPTGSIIDELCARLDGIPLAIELAAARTRALTPGQILAHLDARFDLLTGARRGTPDRHQTLRATVDWSYRLLDDDEQHLFDQLSVFDGSFSLPAAAALIGDDEIVAAHLLDGLVSKSMVVTQAGDGGGWRFRLLETLRAYADERLRARPGLRLTAITSHDAHYLRRLGAIPMSHAMARDLRTEIETDIDDVRSALGRNATTELAGSVPAATVPFIFLLANMGLIAEARTWCDAAMAMSAPDRSVAGRLLVARAYLEATGDGSSDFRTVAAEALTHLAPGDGIWSGAVGMTSVPLQIFAPADAVRSLDADRSRLDGLDGVEADQDRATLDFYLGGALMNLRRFDAATEVFLRSARVLAVLEPSSLIRLWSACGAAVGRTLDSRHDEALAVLDDVAHLIGWTDWAVEWAFARALALARSGRIDEARRPLCALGARMGLDSPSPLSGTVVAGFAVIAAMEGRRDRAIELFAPLTATRSAASTAAVYEVIGQLEGWTDEEFFNCKVTRALVALSQQGEGSRSEYFAHLSALAREEVIAAS